MGVLKPTTSATTAFTNQPVLLATQNPAAVLDLRFPGQMADVETGLFYNYFRSYQPNQGRYTQGDPIGLAGGWSRFGYANGSPLMFTDPLGLWSFSAGGYAGVGGEVAFGKDPNTCQGFMTVKFGWGAGGGAKFDLRGGRPGSGPGDNPRTSGITLGVFGDLDFNAGPVQASMQNNLGRYIPFWQSSSVFRDFMKPNATFGDSWGLKATAAAGGEISVFTASPQPVECGCKR